MKIHHMPQGSEEWDAFRSKIPTASEFHRIYTGGGKVSEQREMYMRRLSIAVKYQVPQFMGNEWTERGHALEPEARERLVKETGWDIRTVGICTRDHSVRGASPDALIYHRGHPIGGVEIKCYKMDKHLGIVNDGKLPTANKPQVHGQLDVTGLQVWLFVVYCPEAYPLDFRIIEVTPNAYQRDLSGELDKFEDEHRQKWPQYLAEYEVDHLRKSPQQMAPITYALLNQNQSKEEVV